MQVRHFAAFGRRVLRAYSPRDRVRTTTEARELAESRPGGAPRALFAAFALTAVAVLAIASGATAQDNGAGKVLVFTGTAEAPNASTTAAVGTIQDIGEDNDFAVDVSSNATDVNATNLANYRAVVFVHSSGEVLNASQAEALEGYVNDGGGFVGIGETANLQPGASFYDTLIGARPDAESSSDTTAQDVEFLDRVHPATRDLPALAEGHSDVWYEWASNPTGTVHTVARARFGTIPTPAEFPGSGEPPEYVTEVNILDAGDSIVSDTVKDDLSRAVSWCRDIEDGRSFYTAMGRVSSAYETENLELQLTGAIQWAAGMVRGNCGATINSNYQATRLTPPMPSDDPLAYVGEVVDMDIADNGLVFYVGRAACGPGGSFQRPSWDQENGGLGCGPLHVWDPEAGGSTTQNPNRIDLVEMFDVFGNRGGGSEAGLTGKSEHGLTGVAIDPDFSNGRPYIYLDWWPYFADEHGPGFERHTFMSERRTSRFTYDFETKSLVDGSERVVFHYMTQAYACCHNGASMAFDSEGNLHIPSGDFTGNNPNGANGGYQNAFPNYTLPAFGTPEDPAIGTCFSPGSTSPTTNQRPSHNLDPEICAGGLISYADARTSSGSTYSYDGSMIRIRPLDNPAATAPGLAQNYEAVPATTAAGAVIPDADSTDWGLGTHYTLPDADSPNGPNMYALNSPEVQNGLAKPEIYSMGLRNFYSVEIDPDTDLISGGSVGPDMNSHTNNYGLEGHSAHTLMPEAGNYLGWPYCWANGIGYRKKIPTMSNQQGGAPVGTPGTIPGPPADAEGEATGGWNDCRNPILNDSPYNSGIETVPAPKPVNFWWGRSNLGCPDYRRDQNLLPFNFVNAERFERCPFAKKSPTGGGQAAMTGGFYRQSQNDPSKDENAWPAYWEGRWFLFNYSSANTARHAVLMPENPDNESDAIAADGIRNIVTSGQISEVLGHEWGPDGALYVVNYGGGAFNMNNNKAVWRYTYHGGDDTPGPDPQSEATGVPGEAEFSLGNSGGIDHEWDFGNGDTTDETNPTRTFDASHPEVTLTITYADGEEASRTFEADVIGALAPTNTDAPELMGTGAPGAMLTCERGEWTGNGSYSYEWTLEGEPVEVGTDEGQTGSTNPTRYRADADDAGSDVVCHVTRTSPGYGASAPAASNAVELGAGPAGPENTVAPTLTGSGNIGTMLTCNRGEWTGSGAYSYSWTVDGDPVAVGTGAGQTGSTNPARFRAMAEYSGDQVVCHVTRNGSDPASSNAVTIGS